MRQRLTELALIGTAVRVVRSVPLTHGGYVYIPTEPSNLFRPSATESPHNRTSPRWQTSRHRRQFHQRRHPLRRTFYADVIQPVRERVPAAPKASEFGRDEHIDDEQL